MSEQIEWVNLGHVGAELRVASFDDTPSETALLIRANSPFTEAVADTLRKAGFRKIKGPKTVWARRGRDLKLRELRAAFPLMRAVHMDLDDTRFRVRGPSPFYKAPTKVTLPKPVNPFQVKYHPGSKLGTPIAMIPVNMAEPTRKALERVEAFYGPIDDFVAARLDMTVHEMEKVLSPEQIDAIALGIAATERGREFILADQTGLGKGRVLAGLALAAVVSNKPLVFITEKANLFSDFWRDLKDIGADKFLGQPFLLNSGSDIVDVSSLNGDILFQAMEDKELRKVIKSGKLPDGMKFMMCTYSQFNQLHSAKGDFLENVADGAFVLVDEAHNAAGDGSNTSQTLEIALARAWGVLRSSATFARRVSSLLAYLRVLPPSLRTETARELLLQSGNVLAEVLSESLAEDGVLVRREHDLSEINIEVVFDNKRKARNAAIADALAPILVKLSKLQYLVNDEIENRNEEIGNPEGKPNKPRWYTANFGSRLQPLMRQFMTALSVDHCVEECVDYLMRDIKPVIVIEQTMESLMRELSDDMPSGDDNSLSDVAPVATEEDGVENTDPSVKPPAFRDALSLMLSRIMEMSYKVPKKDPERIKVDDPTCIAEAKSLQDMIDAFPDLSLSPIDDIRDKVEAISRDLHAAGKIPRPWVMNEISARGMRVVNGNYIPYKPPLRNETIVGFNSGRIDGLVLTRAASTGLSLHAAAHFADRRQRAMIELQIAANVVERVQFFGRVNRRGQVSTPFFKTLGTGLPSQVRTLANENRKLAMLSANVSANAENATAMDVPDIIDSVGNEIAQRMLEDQPRLAERMGIAMKNIDQDVAEAELYYINKLLQRLCFLKTSEQEAIFERLQAGYADMLAGLKAQGKTPRGTRELKGQWKEVSREVYEPGNEDDGPVFGRAVEIVTMEGESQRDPLSSARVLETIREARARLGKASGNAVGPFFEAEINLIKKNRRNVLQTAVSGRLISVDTALKDREDNAVKRLDTKLTFLQNLISITAPGVGITVPDEDDDRKHGIIVDVLPPEVALLHNPGQWRVRYALPGEGHIKEVSFATILRDPQFQIIQTRPADQLNPDLAVFDRAPRGNVKEIRTFLSGNLVKAVAAATDVQAGSLVAWYDMEGVRHRSVLVNQRKLKALLDRASRASDPKKCLEVLMVRNILFSNPAGRMKGLLIEKLDKGFQVRLPATKEFQPLSPDQLEPYCQTFRTEKGEKLARVSDMEIERLLTFLFSKEIPLHYDSSIDKPKVAPQGFGQKGQSGPRRGPPPKR